MSAYPKMNTGWQMMRPDNSFLVPQRENQSGSLWKEELGLEHRFRRLFSFRWVGRLENVRYIASPFLTRASGVAELGGTYDYVLLDFMQAQAQIQRQALKLAEFSDPKAAHLNALHVRVFSGEFYDADMHWLELHNPYTWQRETFELADLEELIERLEGDIVAADKVFQARQAAADPHPTLAAFKVKNMPTDELLSASLLLAELFSSKRIPFATITKLRAALPDYATTHRCLSELGEDGIGADIGWQQLAKLYG